MRIGEVDPVDEAALAAWCEVHVEAERFGREETATPWQLPELRELVQGPTSAESVRLLAGEVDGRVVVAGWLRLPLLDNLARAGVAVYVRPSHRRRGLGSAMARHLERMAAAHGRTVLDAEASWPHGVADPATEAGPGFAAALGFDLALLEVERVLRLPVPDEVLSRLAREAAPHHAAYTLCSWTGAVPEDLVPGWVRLSASLSTEAPVGALTLEPEAADESAHREAEALLVRQGRRKFCTVALDGAGEVVAYTDLVTSVHDPGRAEQWGTLVRGDHRGHRLGMAVKVANLRLLQDAGPSEVVVQVITWNAAENAHMVAVNDALGFRPVEAAGQFQKLLAGRPGPVSRRPSRGSA